MLCKHFASGKCYEMAIYNRDIFIMASALVCSANNNAAQNCNGKNFKKKYSWKKFLAQIKVNAM